MSSAKGSLVMKIKEGDFVRIGEDVEVHVVLAGGHGLGRSAKIRIIAPREKAVRRERRQNEETKEG